MTASNLQRDLVNNVDPSNNISPQTIGSNGTTNGAAIDTKGCRSLTFVMNVGTRTDGDFTLGAEESDNGTTGWTAIAADGLLGTGPTLSTSDSVAKLGIRRAKRYVRSTVTAANVTSGAPVGVTGVRGHLHFGPEPDSVG